jgi:RHS repeat-associated protein
MTDGPGFTGHEDDAATGLSYMQQRYYDPGIGRFLSVDPVTADGNTGGNFNRYWYANNNPYKFTDPDGRLVETFVDQIRSHQLDCGSACQFAFATKSKNSVSTKSCQLGNSLQNVSEKISDAGAKLEFGGLALAGYGASAIGPEGAIPGLTLSGVGGLGLTGGGALQAVGGALQIGADPSTGKHNLAAGLTSVATSALTSTLSSSFLRNGQNFVTRAFNQRVELKFATGGAVLDSLSQVSDFFETKQASCPVLSK